MRVLMRKQTPMIMKDLIQIWRILKLMKDLNISVQNVIRPFTLKSIYYFILKNTLNSDHIAVLIVAYALNISKMCCNIGYYTAILDYTNVIFVEKVSIRNLIVMLSCRFVNLFPVKLIRDIFYNNFHSGHLLNFLKWPSSISMKCTKIYFNTKLVYKIKAFNFDIVGFGCP